MYIDFISAVGKCRGNQNGVPSYFNLRRLVAPGDDRLPHALPVLASLLRLPPLAGLRQPDALRVGRAGCSRFGSRDNAPGSRSVFGPRFRSRLTEAAKGDQDITCCDAPE